MTTISDLTMEQLSSMSDADLAKLEAGEAIETTESESVSEDSQPQADVEQEQVDTTEAEKPDGVSTKAGKGIIPYSVLEGARENLAEAERKATQLAKEKAEAQAKLDEMTKKLESFNADVGDAELMSDDEIDALNDELPEVAATVKSMKARQKALAAQLQEKDAMIKSHEIDTAKKSVQAAIDDVPKLAHIQTTSPRLFQMAVDIDNELKGDPAMQSLPMAQRFEKAIEKLESELGFEIKLASQKSNTEKQASKPVAPLSLSDIPSGVSVTDESADADENATQLSMIEKMSRMTPQQLEAYLSS